MAELYAPENVDDIGRRAPVGGGRKMPEKWSKGKAIIDSFYYDEPVPSYTLEKNNASHMFPPDGLDLSDVWVTQIVESDLRKEERFGRWPAVFSSKCLVSNYQNKGPAGKHLDATGKWHYDVVFGKYQMHGQEGKDAGFVFDLERKLTTKRNITDGKLCVEDGGNSHKESASQLRTFQVQSRTDGNSLSGSMTKRKRGGNSQSPSGKRLHTDNVVAQQPAPMFHIPVIMDSDSDEDINALRAQNDTLRSKLVREERKLVLLAETMAQVHGLIDPLIARTGDAAELLKKATKIATTTTTRKDHREDLEAMTKFYKNNATEVNNLVNDGSAMVQKVHSSYPKLGRRIFFHDEKDKKDLTDWVQKMKQVQKMTPTWKMKPIAEGEDFSVV